MSETRKIAAILVVDVVGYSRLADADEERTLARLRALRTMTAMARTLVLPEATAVGALSAEGVRKLFDCCRKVVWKWNCLRFFSLCEAIGLENSPLSSVPSVLTQAAPKAARQPYESIGF